MAAEVGYGDGRWSLSAGEAAVCSSSEVLRRMSVESARGLDTGLVEQRRKAHGLNEFLIKEEDPLWRKYLNQVKRYWWALFGMCDIHASYLCFSSTTH